MWDRPVSRKHGYEFDPKPVLELAKKLPLPHDLDEEGRRNLVQDYIDVSQRDIHLVEVKVKAPMLVLLVCLKRLHN